MSMAGPEVHFIDSKYFTHVKQPEDSPISFLTMRLKPGASDADKRELEEYVNHGLEKTLKPFLKELGVKHPYWTWEGKLVDKDSLPKDYPYNKGWRGIWDDYYKRLSKLKPGVMY